MSNYRAKSHRKDFLTIYIIAIVASMAFLALFIYDGYPQKIINHITGNKAAKEATDKTLVAWETCLDQLHHDADVVFFGDSIIRQSDFAAYFPEKSICNLGLGSDTLAGMLSRVNMIASVSPETIFIMGGINSLKDNTIDQSVHEYDLLLSEVLDKCKGDVYVISTLPISSSASSKNGCSPETIRSFNDSLKSLTEKFGIHYIDLYSRLAADDGFIINEMTTDGIHLTKIAYDIWHQIILPTVESD